MTLIEADAKAQTISFHAIALGADMENLESTITGISDKLKRLIELYEPDISFKGVRLYPEDLNDNCSYLYWWADFPKIDFSFDPNKDLPEPLKLNQKLIHEKNIFLIDKILQRKLIVSLPLAESMLRRDMGGFTLHPVILY